MKAQFFTSPSPGERPAKGRISGKGDTIVLEHVLDIILVEDNPNDAELTLDALQTHGLANRVKVLRDGQEALD